MAALNPYRLRRALSLSSSFFTFHRHLSTTSSAYSFSSSSRIPSTTTAAAYSRRFFHSSIYLSLSSSPSFNDANKIDADTILFEGCDYKHWLIVMDFGKDPQQRPPPDEMVDTYVQTCAKVLGSVEEAKKKIYACSTTTYTGFQVEVDEETSQKFEGLPGVLFVLPDSYIDPVNKEYGGDKYVNGTIIPRPPPVSYGRVRRGRRDDQRPMSPMASQQENQSHEQYGSMSAEGRGYMPQGGVPERQKFPPNYGPAGQGGRSNPMSNRTNYSEERRDGYQGGVNRSNPMSNRTTYSEERRDGYQGGVSTYAPPYQGNYNHGYNHAHQVENRLGDHGSYVPRGSVNTGQEHGYNRSQGQMRNFPENHGGYTPQRQMEYPGDKRNYAPPAAARGADGHTGVGHFEQRGAGRYRQEPNETYGEEASTGYGPECTSQVENQRYSQAPDEQKRNLNRA